MAKEFNARVGRGQRQINGKKVMTAKRIAQVKGMGYSAILPRLTKLKTQYPNNIYSFPDEYPLYFDEVVIQALARDIVEHPLLEKSILSRKKYDKFMAKYAGKKDEDAAAVNVSTINNADNNASNTVNVEPQTYREERMEFDMKTGKSRVLSVREVQVPAAVKTQQLETIDSASEVEELKAQLLEMTAKYNDIKSKYEQLQGKYVEKLETFADKFYDIAMMQRAYARLQQTWTGFQTPRIRPTTLRPTSNKKFTAVSRPSMMNNDTTIQNGAKNIFEV